ncbi:MAG: phosphoglycerate transporter protein PgtP [Chlamydiales bacterium]|nr:phosphoglycerate transporter protein PgtP [Chlamydiales bacterium]
MSTVWNVFKPAPHLKEIQDEEIVKKQYKYWRLRIFYTMYIGYAFYYFTRKSYTFAMPALMENLGFDESQLGFLGTVLAITYGVSKFTSGILSDKSNPRFFMGIGLILTGVMNLFFGMSSSLFFFALFWGLNGWFQGWGWPPCARLLTHWYSQKERGTWWGLWNSSHNIGGFLIPFIAAYAAQLWGWRAAMFIPGCMCILLGFFIINRLRDTPQSLGLPPIEKFRNDYPGRREDVVERELSVKEILVEYVLKNKYIWVLAIAYFFVYVIRTAINDWTALFLVKEKGYSQIGAAASVSLFELGGFLGGLTAGWSSDKICAGKRGPINVLFTLGALVGVYLFYKIPAGFHLLGYTHWDATMLFIIGFCIFGPQMLIGVAAAELSHKKAAATSTGFVGCFAYLGAASAGFPIGIVIRDWGWVDYFTILSVCGLIATLVLMPLWSIKINPKA